MSKRPVERSNYAYRMRLSKLPKDEFDAMMERWQHVQIALRQGLDPYVGLVAVVWPPSTPEGWAELLRVPQGRDFELLDVQRAA